MEQVYMTLSEKSKQVLLQTLYYSPNTQYTYIRVLYEAVKNKDISQDEVRTFIRARNQVNDFKNKERLNTTSQ